MYSPLALQGVGGASQWRLLQPLLPELGAPGASSAAGALAAPRWGGRGGRLAAVCARLWGSSPVLLQVLYI